jgi:hypothetical protein
MVVTMLRSDECSDNGYILYTSEIETQCYNVARDTVGILFRKTIILFTHEAGMTVQVLYSCLWRGQATLRPITGLRITFTTN